MSEIIINPTLPESIQVDPNTGAVIIQGFNDQQSRLNGNNGNDMINLGSLNDAVAGLEGNDTIFAGEGDDSVVGNQGDDFLQGKDGNDTLQGKDGNDFLQGNRGDDILLGEQGNDTIRGKDGNDFLDGGLDNDSLLGDRLNDTVIGGEGNDTIFGGKNDDFLDGGEGNDILEGGEGADIFRFQWSESEQLAPDAIAQPFGLDTLTDFNSQEDIIQLDQTIFEELGTTENDILAENEFTTITNFDPSNPETAGEANLVYDSIQGLVYYIDENDVSVPIMQMESGLNPTNDNFEII